MSYIVSAVEAIAGHLHPGILVVLESTTYPATDGRAAVARTHRSESGQRLLSRLSPERSIGQ